MRLPGGLAQLRARARPPERPSSVNRPTVVGRPTGVSPLTGVGPLTGVPSSVEASRPGGVPHPGGLSRPRRRAVAVPPTPGRSRVPKPAPDDPPSRRCGTRLLLAVLRHRRRTAGRNHRRRTAGRCRPSHRPRRRRALHRPSGRLRSVRRPRSRPRPRPCGPRIPPPQHLRIQIRVSRLPPRCPRARRARQDGRRDRASIRTSADRNPGIGLAAQPTGRPQNPHGISTSLAAGIRNRGTPRPVQGAGTRSRAARSLPFRPAGLPRNRPVRTASAVTPARTTRP